MTTLSQRIPIVIFCGSVCIKYGDAALKHCMAWHTFLAPLSTF